MPPFEDCLNVLGKVKTLHGGDKMEKGAIYHWTFLYELHSMEIRKQKYYWK